LHEIEDCEELVDLLNDARAEASSSAGLYQVIIEAY
jgi:hypothetical protein